jgi:hypothetical protein
METVQLRCGNCSNLMAIGSEHLGGQVRCPHCLTVVQAPPVKAPVSAPEPPETPEIATPSVETGEVESIFSPPPPSEDVFDSGPQRPLVELPPESEPEPAAPALMGANGPTSDASPLFTGADPQAGALPQMSAETSAEGHSTDFTTLRRSRPIFDRSYVGLVALVFFIPYSIVSTLIIFYLLHQLSQQTHPLELMPDPVPAPKKGGAQEVERVKHDHWLAEKLKAPLGQKRVVGELEVTPRKVVLNDLGELELVLHVKNVSRNQAFSPMHPDFLKSGTGTRSARPYTFLDSPTLDRLYGGHLAFRRGEETTGDGELGPGQEEDVVLTTKGDHEIVGKIVASAENLTWRVQLRRGLVAYNGQKVSTTAVIGVQFNAHDIEKGAG